MDLIAIATFIGKYAMKNPFSAVSLLLMLISGLIKFVVVPYLKFKKDVEDLKSQQEMLIKVLVGDGEPIKFDAMDKNIAKICNRTFGKDDDNPEEYCLSKVIEQNNRGIRSLAKLYSNQKKDIETLNKRDEEIKTMLYNFLMEMAKKG